MTTVVTTAATLTPITVDEVKSNSRITGSDENMLLYQMILSAVSQWESLTGMALLSQTVTDKWQAWPMKNCLDLARWPVQSVSAVAYIDSTDASTAVSSSLYRVETASNPARVWLNYNQSWPTATLQNGLPISATYLAGYTSASAVPSSIRQALLLAVGDIYENRERFVQQPGIVQVESAWWRNAIHQWKVH